jgi:5-methylcytosine-specific restriction enzyme A
MPVMPGTICADCPKKATLGRYCDDHQEQNQHIEDRRARDYHRREHDPFRHLYNTVRWFRTRKKILARDPLCKSCGHKASKITDHVVKARVWIAAHGNDPESFYDEINLQGLCKLCHDMKTRRGE